MPEMSVTPFCGYGDCTKPAEFYGPLWTSLDHNETYPVHCCAEHTDNRMAIIRVVGWPVTDQPTGYPVITERP